MNQSDFAALAGTTKKTQITYEKGVMPDAGYLAAIAASGADITYIVTGERHAQDTDALSSDERELIALFRAAGLTGKAAAIGALQGAAGALGGANQTINAPIYGTAGRDMLVNSVRGKAK